MPLGQGMAIQETIKQCRIPKVSAVAIHGVSYVTDQTREGGEADSGCGYGFYGIQAHYKNADVKIYLLDTGVAVIPVATDTFVAPGRGVTRVITGACRRLKGHVRVAGLPSPS